MKLPLFVSIAAFILLAASGIVQAHEGEHHHKNKDVMKADANGDGKVSFEEFRAAHEKRLKAKFERKDINKDGFIDPDEKQIAQKKRREKIETQKQKEREALRKELSEERKKRKKHFYKYK